jgi:glycosyltransferase involved in cell wall biosynthesis
MKRLESINYGNSAPLSDDIIFSIVIPSWNNLDFLKLCIQSLKKNSRYQHQIIVHINEGTDGTLEWIKTQKIDYSYSCENVGVCYAVNAAASLATADYIVYMNDDMYVCPDWDFYLLNEIKNTDGDSFFFSSTLIEPKKTSNNCVLVADYGTCPSDFDEERLLKEYNSFSFNDWNGASWPPNVVSRRMWNLIGGYSIEFFPGMYSDPDFSMKLWQAGVRNFKGISNSRVYHFMSKSTGKLKPGIKGNGKKLFLNKWQITSRTFYDFYLKMGTPFAGALPDKPKPGLRLKIKNRTSDFKRRFL